MRKKLAIVATLIVAVLLCAYAGHKIHQKYKWIQSAIADYKVVINSSQLLLAQKSQPFDVQEPLKVVCLGNSITKHGYLPDVEWYSDWGMSASKEDNDYCHVLQRRLKQYNVESEVLPLNIAHFERNPTCDIDSLLGNICNDADIIVIRFGENVQDVELFKNNIQRLIDKCKNYTPQILISGCFWLNGDTEKVLVNSALDNGLHFIPLSWIAEMRDAYPTKGDAIYNVEGNPYKITKEFILTHPNDEGMESIANSIFNAITLLELNN